MNNIDELIDKLSNELISLVMKNDMSESLADWLFFLIVTNHDHLISLHKNYVFMKFNDKNISLDDLYETGKITSTVGYLASATSNSQEFNKEEYDDSDIMIMYDIIDNVGYPVIALKLPRDCDTEEKIIAAKEYFINLYENANYTTEKLEIEIGE